MPHTPVDKRIIHSVFEEVAARVPDTVAVQETGRSCTYGELNRRANRWSRILGDAGVGPEDVVGLFLRNGVDFVAALLAVHKAGAAYLPLDVDIPGRRFELMLRKTRPRAILLAPGTESAFDTLVTGHSEAVPPVVRLAADGAAQIRRNGDGAWTDAPATDDGNPTVLPDPDGGAYVLFTSGSTGEPKAIHGRHKGLAHFIHWERTEFGLGAETRGTNLAPPTFDVNLRDVFVPLTAGGTVCVPPPEAALNPVLLAGWIEAQAVTLVHIVPSIFRLLLKEMESGGWTGARFPALRHILLAGEPLLGRDVQRWMDLMGERVQLVNLYGPSETTLAKLHHRIVGRPDDPRQVMPLGQPISNTAVLILDGDRLTAVGEVGEICIKTPFRSKGYFGDPALTASRFVPNPLTGDAADIVYRTGDLGRYGEGRRVEFVGRADRQVKLNGVRVEPAETERALQAIAELDQAVVDVHRRDNGDDALVCYYTEKAPIDTDTLRRRLAEDLPAAFIPSFFIRMPAFPLNAHGKIDRPRLPKPEDAAQAQTPFEAPRTDAERGLAECWGEVLGLTRVGVKHSFLDLGGNSLHAMRVVARVYRLFGVELGIGEFFAQPTVRQLAALIETRLGAAGERRESIPPAPLAADYPLSHAQRRLWYLEQIEQNFVAYNIPRVLRLRGRLDVAAFEQAFQDLIARHESLRTVIIGAGREVRQKVLTDIPFRVPVTDLREDPDPGRRAGELARADSLAPFDLARGPLLRVSLLRMPATSAEAEYGMLFNMHHIVSDAWSLDILMREHLACYRARLAGHAPALPPLPIQYKDFAVWQERRLAEGGLASQRTYWLTKLAGDLAPLDLPADFPRPPVQRYDGASLRHAFDTGLTRELARFCAARNLTPFNVLTAALKILLHRYTGQSTIVLGMPVAGRGRPELEDQIGFYVNTLALRDELTRSDTVEALLGRIRQTLSEAQANQDYPFDRLVEELALPRDVSRTPLYDVGLTMYDERGQDAVAGDLAWTVTDTEAATAKQDLQFNFHETNTGFTVEIIYATCLFRPERIARVARHLEEVLGGMIRAPGLALGELAILPADEWQQVVERFNDTAFPMDESGPTMAERFEQTARTHANRPAVLFHDRVITYAELDRMANGVAHELVRTHGIEPEQCVAVFLERSEWLIVSLLGILKAGGVYVPVNPDSPPERLQFQIQDSGAKVLLTDADRELPALPGVARLDPRRAAGEGADRPPARRTNDRQLAYIIYTSGSTGTPKGVLLEHRGFIQAAEDFIGGWPVTSEDRFLQFFACGFDGSMADIFAALFSGAALVLVDRETLGDPALMLQYLWKLKPTCAVLPPSYLHSLQRADLPFRALSTAGEAADVDDALHYARRMTFINGFGPTEASVCCCRYKVDPAQSYPMGIPIGRPNANTRLYVLDPDLRPVPIGVPGELCIAGVGLARGYLNRPDLTAQAFLPDPFRPGERLYRSGDRVRWRDDGALEYVGRTDDQVKIRGFRIEPDEIAHALRQHPEVTEAFVMARPGSQRDKTLVAYYQFRPRITLWPSLAEFFVYDETLYQFMASHKARNDVYRAALAPVVAGATVLEIGPGPFAILSRLCLEAGAREVVAVEYLRSTWERAVATVRELGLEDRLHVIHGDIREVKLDRQFDWCVSEIVGPIGGSEGSALLINHARRFLRDPSHMIPGRSLTRLAAVTLSADRFVPLFPATAARYVESIFREQGGRFDLRLCLDGVTRQDLISTADALEDLDYTRPVPPEHEHDIELTFTQDSLFHGLLAWLVLYTDADHSVDILDTTTSWLPVYMPVSVEGIPVRSGDRFRAHVSRTLFENRLNPSFRLVGRLERGGRPTMDITVDSPHRASAFRAQPFYAKVFDGDRVPVVADVTEADLRRHLRTGLPEYMVPARFVRVDRFPLTPAGKVDRRALPEPSADEATADAAVTAPRNECERALLAVWCEVLERKNVGRDESFFALGGDSIRAIQMAARLRERQWAVSVRDLFLHPTIADLAPLLRPLTRQADQAPVTGRVPLTPIQRWFFEEQTVEPHHFNQALMLKADAALTPDHVRAALAAIQSHHDMLRATWRIDSGAPVIELAGPDQPSVLREVDLRGQGPATVAIEADAAAEQARMDLARGPLLRSVLYRTDDGVRLLLAVHHLVVDGVSWRILLDDLERACAQVRRGEPVGLPPRSDSFRRWAEALQAYARSALLLGELLYWQRVDQEAVGPQESDTPPVRDPQRTGVLTAALSAEGTRALRAATSGSDLLTLLLASFGSGLAEVAPGRDRFAISLEGHGREPLAEELDVQRTVGWFTALYPFVLPAPSGASAADRLAAVRAALREVPNKGIGYGILRYLTPVDLRAGVTLRARPSFSFNYLGQFNDGQAGSLFRVAPEHPGPSASPHAPLHHDLGVVCLISDGQLRVTASFAGDRIAESAVRRLLDRFLEEVVRLAGEGGTPPEAPDKTFDFDGLRGRDLDEFVAEI